MTREAAIAAVLGEVQERWGIHSLTRGYAGARGSGLLASRASQGTPSPSLPPWWPGTEGYLRPTILELSGPASCGKLSLALLWLAATSRGGLVAVVDLAGTFYPPAASAAGLDLGRLVVVRPPDRRASVEAVSLLLSSGGFDSVLWPLEWRMRPFNLDSVRLSTLAARSNTTLLALVTDHRRARSPGASTGRDTGSDADRLFPSADLRLRVTGWEWTWRDGELAGVRPRVRTERLRGAPAGQAWELQLEHHTPSAPDIAAQAPVPGTVARGLVPRAESTHRTPADLVTRDEASTWQADRPGAHPTGSAGTGPGTPRPAPNTRHPAPGTHAGVRPGPCPPTDHLCLAAALPLGGGGVRATGPAGTADRGVRPDEAPAPASRSA